MLTELEEAKFADKMLFVYLLRRQLMTKENSYRFCQTKSKYTSFTLKPYVNDLFKKLSRIDLKS